MKLATINLKSLSIVVADPNLYIRRIVIGMLRGFGATSVFDVDSSISLLKMLSTDKIDMLLCDAQLLPHNGHAITRSIRKNESNENRTIPILMLSSDTREFTIKAARDAGANMIIAKPLSPKVLYDKLAWIAFNQRQFIDAKSYFGPDRRFKIEGYPGGIGRRKGDKVIDVAAEAGPSMAQNEIDNLFSAARVGQSE